MSIASENAKQIRKGMEVFINLNIGADDLMAAVGTTGGIKVSPGSDTERLSGINMWPWRKIADFQGDGFPLDGSYKLWDGDSSNSQEKGVIGYRTIVGRDVHGTFQFDEQDTYHVPALTVRFASGVGTITVNGVSYDIQETVIVPCLGRNTPFDLQSSDSTRRVEIFSVTPGFNLSITNDDLISCTLALRSDLSPDNPSFPISEIEVQAFQSADMSQALVNVAKNTKLTYRAGYAGSYSTVRSFYISEPIKTENKVITIKAEDSSHLLDTVQIPAQLYSSNRTTGKQRLYTFFRDAIKKCGINPVSIQSAPPQSGDDTEEKCVIFTERSTREHIQNIMNLSHTGDFWPTFVDGGTPKITWSKPTAKWDIYESDCGEVQRFIQQSIGAITTEYENGLTSETKKEKASVYLYSDAGYFSALGHDALPGILGGLLEVNANVNVIENFDSFYWKYDVLGQPTTRIWTEVSSLCFRPSKTSTSSGAYKVMVLGYPVTVGSIRSPRGRDYASPSTIYPPDNRPGIPLVIEPIIYGVVHQGPETFIGSYRNTAVFPKYENLFDRSTITGSILWKGDPRMQPRDVFNFHRLNGTVETCTIESIELKHEGGGTSATISYRLGVV